MSEDTQSTIFNRRRVVRGPLVVTNPGNESDDDDRDYNASYSTYKPPPLPTPSPTSHSPYSEQSSQPSTSYGQKVPTPLTTVIPDQSHAYAGRSNPSLSSPSGSSSPAVESTPPPSTPGQLLPPSNPTAEPNDRMGTTSAAVQAQTAVPRTGSILTDKSKHYAQYPSREPASRSNISPSTVQAYGSPIYPGDAINNKVLVIVTADCEVYIPLDITGARNAAIIREKIFSKLQIPDDQQPLFSIYRTEIGSFAIGSALSDPQLMDVCRDEGDSKGSLKFLVQHTSAAVHLPPRSIAASVVPPVLPYQENYHPPSSKGHSPHSIHESMSSTSESRVHEGHANTGYEGSISDDMDQYERDRNRYTMRPPPQQATFTQPPPGYPSSPLDQRRRNASTPREPSPTSRRGASPPRVPPNDMGNTHAFVGSVLGRMGPARSSTQSEYAFPTGQPSPSLTPRRVHAHTGSDAAAERERALELSERKASEREYRVDRDNNKGKERRRGQEPWVLVDSVNPSDRPSTSGSVTTKPMPSRPFHHTQSNSHSGSYPTEGTNKFSTGPYSISRLQLPFVSNPPRHPPPPVPTTGSSRTTAQQVPKNWVLKHVADQGQRTLQPPKPQSRWLSSAKSAGDLRALGSLGQPSRRPSQQLPKALLVGQKESPSSLSSGSFINMDPPGRETRESNVNAAGLPRSYETMRNIPFSPTSYANTRSTGVTSATPNQTEYPATGSRLPMQSNSANASTSHVNTANGTWKGNEVMYQRPHSALDDIGASPIPYRPSLASHGSWVDVESALDNSEISRSPLRATSPQHPYAAANPRPSPSTITANPVVATTLRQGIASQGPGNLVSDSATTNTILRSPRGLANPDSPRRTMNDRRDAVYSSHSITGAATSFVSLSQESPTQEADGDDSIGTLKADEHSYLVPMISGSFSSEGTLKPGVSSSRGGSSEGSSTLQSTAPLNVSKSPENHSKSIVDSIDPYSGTFVEDDYDDEDDEDEDEGTNLWKMPLKQPAAEPAREGKRPVLSVDTEGSKRLGIYDNSNRDYQQLLPGATQNILNNLPNPSSFPTPTQRTRKPAANGSKRDSEFIKKSVQTWAFRPPPEDMYENLDVYFPAHDLDKPVIEATSGGSSPTAAEPSSSEGTLPANRTTNTGIRSRHKKSIRNVAAEHKRKIDRSSRADSASTNDMLRRRNTKLWGSKVEEVTPYQARTGIPPVPESPTVDNPTPIFKWVRGDLIGKGTYGRVYLALNVTTGEMIAVKQVEIPKTASDRDDSRQVSVVEALKLESETLKDLDHPNIVQYLGFEKTPDFLSIFLEYVPGGSVAGCLRKHGKFDDQVSRSFTSQILAGLDYLHQNGIIHRDLKADNILVDPSGVCKISDFGISKRTDDINENGIHTSMQGSVFWMAPEVVQAGRKGEKLGYNGKVDIWSLGCVVLEMWAGRRPWQDVDAIAVIYELVTKQGAPPVPPDVHLSPEADDFRRLCFAIKPEERPSASELRKHPYLTLQPGWSFQGFKS